MVVKRNDKGFVLATGLMLLLMITIFGIIATLITTTDLKIASKERSAVQVFLLSEGGIEEARSRLQTISSNKIIDNQTNSANWAAYIGTLDKARNKGFDSGNPGHSRYDSMTNLNYVVSIRHKVNSSNQVLYWGDSNGDGIPEEQTSSGTNIYVITSEGFDTTGSSKSIQIEAASFPPIPLPAALYAKDDVIINGSSATVNGIDQCGGMDKAGIITKNIIITSGSPSINGIPPSIQGSSTDFNILAMINKFKSKANYSYGPGNMPGSGAGAWGNIQFPGGPNQAATCTDRNIVYIKGDVSLPSKSQGCGILMVEGNLASSGGFVWYGAILVAGSIDFRGGVGITGGTLAGSNAMNDTLSGRSVLLYCSRAISYQTIDQPLQILRWVELF